MTKDHYTLGSLCTGAGMLEAGIAQVLPVKVAWHAEKDDDASEVLKRRFPRIPNLGDIKEIDWPNIEPVDALCSGFPCQPFSLSGLQLGQADERFLFDDIADGIGKMVTPPRLLLFENVPGLLTVDGGRSMARVIHRLAALGYVGRYRVLQASDIGACHERARVFIVATHRDWADPPRGRGAGIPVLDGVNGLIPTPAARLGNYDPPRASEQENRSTTRTPSQAAGKHGLYLSSELCELAMLPTPRATDGENGGPNQRDSSGGLAMPSAAMRMIDTFGPYAASIMRWAVLFDRMPPPATVPNRRGEHRLGARFPEWMMGWPDGWVTDLVDRKAALRIVGNGVVPQQVALAYSLLLDGELT